MKGRKNIGAVISAASKECLDTKELLEQALFLLRSGCSLPICTHSAAVGGSEERRIRFHVSRNGTAVAIITVKRVAYLPAITVSVTMVPKHGPHCWPRQKIRKRPFPVFFIVVTQRTANVISKN